MTTKRFYILTDGDEFDEIVEMDAEELEDASAYCGEGWSWVAYDRENDDMRDWVRSLREELPQDY